jgi:hypothetical protein
VRDPRIRRHRKGPAEAGPLLFSPKARADLRRQSKGMLIRRYGSP